ncbi:MAG TPA: stage II sporulation protein M [Candidatus Omnitrophota bacterium]|nr:stage II sporulation protein M [Candidatus Omnitrophota bacterium]
MADKKGKFSLKENYKDCFSYLKSSKNFIFAVIFIFAFFTLVGLFVPLPNSVSSWILNYIQQIVKQTENLSGWQLMLFIFFNNIKSSLFGLVLGIILGVIPAFLAFFNGYILGFVLNKSINADGIFVIWKLLPHGIFELPAVFISLGLGLQIGTGFLFGKKKKNLKKNFIKSLKVFLLIVIPLLLIAAIIEGALIILVS